jgi:hypothetical protein
MTRAFGTIVAAATALLSGGSVEHGVHLVPVVTTIVETDSLPDVAMAVYSPEHPVIYVNPQRMQQFGPLLADFFLAHEQGHIHYRHTRSNALSAGVESRDSMIQHRELEADCYAAATLSRTNRLAVAATVRFFAEMGPYRFDREHPAGAQRAATILSCIPVDSSRAR